MYMQLISTELPAKMKAAVFIAAASAAMSVSAEVGAVSEDLSVELFERTNADASVTFGIKVAKKIGLVIMVL